jgi:hypothetical protein
MGREVRRVPADWQHPKYPSDHYEHHLRGRYVPLYEGGGYEASAAEWDEEWEAWQRGLARSYSGERWREKSEAERAMRYTEYAGPRPSPDDYMPNWPAEQRTHLMMYEDTSEGTPKSPAFATPEELARYCADNGVSAFGYDTATYEQWLRVAQGGWAPSAVIADGQMISGVAALSGAGSSEPGDQSASAGSDASVVEREGSREAPSSPSSNQQKEG